MVPNRATQTLQWHIRLLRLQYSIYFIQLNFPGSWYLFQTSLHNTYVRHMYCKLQKCTEVFCFHGGVLQKKKKLFRELSQFHVSIGLCYREGGSSKIGRRKPKDLHVSKVSVAPKSWKRVQEHRPWKIWLFATLRHPKLLFGCFMCYSCEDESWWKLICIALW